MNGNTLIEMLENVYPLSKAVSWDNPGLGAGRREKEIHRILIALDATEEVIDQAIKCKADMLLTHHPMLMSPIKKINSDDFMGKRFIKLIQNDIACYAMHTNYDIVTMAQLSAEYLKLENPEVLSVTGEDVRTGEKEGFGRIGRLKQHMTLRELGTFVKNVFELDSVKIFGDLEASIEIAAISPGSGKSMIEPAVNKGAQVLISGDIGHHEGLDAIDRDMAIIDAGHYGLEHIFIGHMAKYLRERLEGVEIIEADIHHPFSVI